MKIHQKIFTFNSFCLLVTLTAFSGLVLWGIGRGISVYWPYYEFDSRLASPDADYDLVVLRGDAAAFADFSYKYYVVPHDLMPANLAKKDRVLMSGTWRDKKFLIYSGFSTPGFRWTGQKSVELDCDVHNLETDFDEFYPVKKIDATGPILISLEFGRNDKGNSVP